MLAWLIVRGRLGRAFRAVRDSEVAAASSGIDLARDKTLAFALSGVYAGVAGALLAIQAEIVNPLTFTFLLSILLLVGAVVGGLGSLPGMVVGAFFVQYLPERLDPRLERAGRAGLRLRRGDHRGDDPAPDAAPAACCAELAETPNNAAVHFVPRGAMRRAAFIVILCALGALALATVASGAASDAGVTSTEVLIGGTTPLSGPAVRVPVGRRRAPPPTSSYVNANGGVNKRKIKYVYKDDAYDPSKTCEQTRELVQQDKVFAIFNSLGTEQNLATRAYLNAIKVPQLFVASGATTFGKDYKQYPWTIGYQPNYRAEGTIYGRYIAKTAPKARIGVLYQNDDYGKDLLTGLKQRARHEGASSIVSKQSYEATDADVQSQIARLKAAKVSTLMLFATPQFAIQSYVYAHKLGWKPKVFVNAVSSASNIMGLPTAGAGKKQTEGSISIVFLKDPTDPHWAKDPGMKLYRSIMKKYKGGEPERRLRRLRHVGRAHVRRGAEEGGQEPDARRAS